MYDLALYLFLAMIAGVLPIAFSVAILCFNIALKSLRGVLQPAALLILYRFQESKQGVLTSVAVGLGVLAKLVQEFAKRMLL
jgi:hypothetical protein